MGGGKEVQEGQGICIPMTDSFECTVETNNVVKQLIKKNNNSACTAGGRSSIRG